MRHVRIGVGLHCVLGRQHPVRSCHTACSCTISGQMVDQCLTFMIGMLRTRPWASGMCSLGVFTAAFTAERLDDSWKQPWLTCSCLGLIQGPLPTVFTGHRHKASV